MWLHQCSFQIENLWKNWISDLSLLNILVQIPFLSPGSPSATSCWKVWRITVHLPYSCSSSFHPLSEAGSWTRWTFWSGLCGSSHTVHLRGEKPQTTKTRHGAIFCTSKYLKITAEAFPLCPSCLIFNGLCLGNKDSYFTYFQGDCFWGLTCKLGTSWTNSKRSPVTFPTLKMPRFEFKVKSNHLQCKREKNMIEVNEKGEWRLSS